MEHTAEDGKPHFMEVYKTGYLCLPDNRIVTFNWIKDCYIADFLMIEVYECYLIYYA